MCMYELCLPGVSEVLVFSAFFGKSVPPRQTRFSLYEHFCMIFGESRKNKTSETPSCIDWEVWIAAWWIKSVVFGQFVATWPIVAIFSLGGGDPPLCYQLKAWCLQWCIIVRTPCLVASCFGSQYLTEASTEMDAFISKNPDCGSQLNLRGQVLSVWYKRVSY